MFTTTERKIELPYGEILFKNAPDISASKAYPGFKQETKLLPKGHQRYASRLPLPCDILMERDVGITLRDGTVVYCDVFRPVCDDKVPAILSISPFGKVVAEGQSCDEGFNGDKFHFKPGTLSGYQKFEAVDPAFWCDHGYAVLNIDSRGINSSEGNACYFGPQDADDGYDMIEWTAGRDWCNGKVTLAGNSWLGINQWYIASTNPPHLACIAPFEGHGDMYNDEYVRGGIPHQHLTRYDLSPGGYHKEEDLYEMVSRYPLWNSYWEDKRAKFEKVTVPAYVAASYTNGCHTHGTFEGFREISSKEKWLRVHNTQEWPDLYGNSEDLLKFFDHYCKGIDNGWENTPTVRMSVLDPGGTDLVGRPEETFPPARMIRTQYYLDAQNAALTLEKPERESVAAYNAENDEQFIAAVEEFGKHYGPFAVATGAEPPKIDLTGRRTRFYLDFAQETEITGYIRLKLWVEVQGYDDMDLFVRAVKLDKDGNRLWHDAMSQLYSGPCNKLRVSHRELLPERCSGDDLAYAHTREQKIVPGEIVPVEISLWPTSMVFHPGERLMIQVAGYDDMGPEGFDFPTNAGTNHGKHLIHTGGRYDSHVILPVVPPKEMCCMS